MKKKKVFVFDTFGDFFYIINFYFCFFFKAFWFYWFLCWIFLDSLDFLWIYWICRDLLRFFFFLFFQKILDFFDFFLFFSKLLRSLLNVTEVTIEHQKWPKISTNSMKSFFCLKGKKSLGRMPKPSTGARSKPA